MFTSTIEILDILMRKQENKFDIVCKFCIKKKVDLQSTIEDFPFEYRTIIIGFPFNFSKAKTELYLNIAWRFVFFKLNKI